MYLLVFVTLVVALVGIYAQVLSVQTAKLFSNQTTVARSMIAWHSTAIAQARYAVAATSSYPAATGCSLEMNLVALPPCQSSVPSSVTVDGAQTIVNVCNSTNTTNCWTLLPLGYNKSPYTFYSIFYTPAVGGKYVITYVPSPATGATNPPPGFLTLPGAGAAGASQIGITMADLIQQIKNFGLTPISYGIVSGQQVTTVAVSNGVTVAPFVYPVPSGGTVPDGSFAIISSP